VIWGDSARRALALTLASFAVWSGWEIFRPARHPFRDLGSGAYTDHFSHVSAARLMPRVGLELWRKPINRLLRPLTRDERRRLPGDLQPAAGWPNGEVYFVPGWPADKPIVASWSTNPRFYPPGDALLFSPVALLYQFTGLSFSTANLLAILLCLVYAHAALYLLLRAQEAEPLGQLAVLAVYFPLIRWTLEGFYDAAAIVPLILCARQLRERRGVEALLAFCAAAAIHFRAYFFAPWAVFAAVVIVRERQWLGWNRRCWMMAAGAALLAMASLVPFALVQPWLGKLAVDNPVSLTAGLQPPLLAFLAVALVAAVLQIRARAWLELAVLAWVSLMLVNLHRAEQWHLLVLLTWLAAPLIAARDRALAVQAKLWFVVCAGVLVFHETIVPSWLAHLS
jgi:hypothetical protein